VATQMLSLETIQTVQGSLPVVCSQGVCRRLDRLDFGQEHPVGSLDRRIEGFDLTVNQMTLHVGSHLGPGCMIGDVVTVLDGSVASHGSMIRDYI